MLTASSVLPHSRKGRRYERKALQIRQFAGVQVTERLDPYLLAPRVRLRVVSLDEIKGLSPLAMAQLIGNGARNWSGGASRPLPDGSRLVILNPTHGAERRVATLMEEICHVFLGHAPTQLAVSVETGVSFRDYNQADEEEAYAVGAAALVPFCGLQKFIPEYVSVDKLAKRYGVSRYLVEYRLKVTGLWGIAKAAGLASDNALPTPVFS